MSKNITIAEGGNAKSFSNTEKIQTNLIGGGTQYWVPEDEAGQYADLEELEVSENGLYIASDAGYDGFSSVSVAVPGGEIPGGKEVKGIATEDLSLYQTVKVVQGRQELTRVTNDTQEGWLRNSNNLVYRLVSNKYNGYNPVTGIIKSRGTSTVYDVTLLNGGEAVALWLSQNSSDLTNKKFKILYSDGKSCEFSISARNIRGIWYGNNLIAVAYYDGDWPSVGDQANTMNIYNKSGKLVTEKMGNFVWGWTGMHSDRIEYAYPISKSKVAIIWGVAPNYSWTFYNAIIYGDRTTNIKTGNSITRGSRGAGDGEFSAISVMGQAGGYFYFSTEKWGETQYKVCRIEAGNVGADFQDQMIVSDQAFGVINNYDHFQAYLDEKYRYCNIKTLTDVYPDIIENSASHSYAESDKYLIFGRTYLKDTQNQIIPITVYPDQHSDDTVLGIMKEDCQGGDEGTVIVLFK